MKKTVFKIFENADEKTIEKMSERYCDVDEKEAEKIYRRSLEKSSSAGFSDENYSVSGVDVITNRKNSTFLRVTSAAAAIAVCVTGTVYVIGKTRSKTENKIFSPSTLTTFSQSTEVVQAVVSESTVDISEKKVNEYLRAWDAFEFDGWTFKVDMLHITKSSRGMTFRQNENFPCDENGVFTCDYSYIVADMTVTNNSDEDREYYTNSSTFYCIDKNEDDSINWKTAVCADVYDFNGEKSVLVGDFFKTIIKAGETKYFRIGYKVEDSALDRKFDYVYIDFGTYLIDNNPDKGNMTVGCNMKLSEIPPIKEYDTSTQEGDY